MPHIHTEPNQHDITVSAWIFREIAGDTKVFVHLHRKIQKYMEVGGHVELDETPWQTIAHELEEESGYSLSELELYQPEYMPAPLNDRIVHPIPIFINTYQPQRGHYHTDICYAFMASAAPKGSPAAGESQNTRWYTLDELERDASEGEVLPDIVEAYKAMADVVQRPYFHLVQTKAFSLGKPAVNEVALEKLANQDALKVTQFGNPVLRKRAKKLSLQEVLSEGVQKLIEAMFHKLSSDMYGVGLAAPQVGRSISLSVIGIKPTPTRPQLKRFNTVIINPSFEGIGEKKEKWEGCISCGSGDDTLYAKVPRYEHIRAEWLDDTGISHKEELKGFVAHVFQHETDHLNGILFVDRVQDSTSYMSGGEYRKRVLSIDKNS